MENFNYRLIRALWNIGAMLPFKVLYLFSDIVYLLVYYVAGYRRKVVRNNLINSFPEKSLDEIVDIEKKFYSSFCDYMVETVKLMRMSPERIKKHMRFEGVDELESMLFSGEGKSSMVYIGHLFNWEFITSLPLHFKKSVQFGQIYHPLASKAMDDLFIELRGQYGSESIAMKNTLRRILEFSHAKKPSKTGFNRSCRCVYLSFGVSASFIFLPSESFPSNSLSSLNISLQSFTPFAAALSASKVLSVGNASTNFLLACAQHPQRIA